MFKQNNTIFITACVFTLNAHAMSPDAPQQKPRSCEEKFIDKFMTCNSSGSSRIAMWLGLGQCSRRAIELDYEQCSNESWEREEKWSYQAVRVERSWNYKAQCTRITYQLPRFSLLTDTRKLDGELHCRNDKGKLFCCMTIDKSQIDFFDQEVDYPDEDIARWRHLHPYRFRTKTVLVDKSIFPALEALFVVQEKPRQRARKLLNEERVQLTKHIPPSMEPAQ